MNSLELIKGVTKVTAYGVKLVESREGKFVHRKLVRTEEKREEGFFMGFEHSGEEGGSFDTDVLIGVPKGNTFTIQVFSITACVFEAKELF